MAGRHTFILPIKEVDLNGDTKLILDTLEKFHAQNRTDIQRLFGKVENINIKLAGNFVEIREVQGKMKWIFTILGAVVTFIILSVYKHVMAG